MNIYTGKSTGWVNGCGGGGGCYIVQFLHMNNTML